MKLIFTRSTLLGDNEDAITWAFGHQCSHFALGFFDEAVMFHSVWDGPGVDDYYEFYKSRKKIYEIEIPISYEEQAQILFAMIDVGGDLDYDYKFFLWLTKVGFDRKILGKDLPSNIKYQNPAAIICHELLNLLPEHIKQKYFGDVDVSDCVMPEDLYVKLMEFKFGL